MALQTNQLINPSAGLVVSYAPSTSGPHTVDCSSERVFLSVVNASGVSTNVTITTPSTDLNGNAIADAVFAVAAGVTRMIALNPVVYGQVASVAFSATASVTFAAIQLP